MGVIDTWWAVKVAPVQLKVTYLRKEAYQLPQTRNLDMNIYEENSAPNFQVQSEREWTLSYQHDLEENLFLHFLKDVD